MYAIVKNNQVKSIGELPTLFPQTSFPPAGPDAGWKAEHGVFEIVEGEQKDQRFYWVTPDSYQVGDGIVTRTYVNTAKALEDVIENVVVEVFDDSTQTMVNTTKSLTTRGLYRAAVITEYNRLKTAIEGTNSVEDLITVVGSQNWPTNNL